MRCGGVCGHCKCLAQLVELSCPGGKNSWAYHSCPHGKVMGRRGEGSAGWGLCGGPSGDHHRSVAAVSHWKSCLCGHNVQQKRVQACSLAKLETSMPQVKHTVMHTVLLMQSLGWHIMWHRFLKHCCRGTAQHALLQKRRIQVHPRRLLLGLC